MLIGNRQMKSPLLFLTWPSSLFGVGSWGLTGALSSGATPDPPGRLGSGVWGCTAAQTYLGPAAKAPLDAEGPVKDAMPVNIAAPLPPLLLVLSLRAWGSAGSRDPA
jgi:hypothetical protein